MVDTRRVRKATRGRLAGRSRPPRRAFPRNREAVLLVAFRCFGKCYCRITASQPVKPPLTLPSSSCDVWIRVSMPTSAEREVLTVAGREVAISNPGKVLFPQPGHTKLDLARYYLAVSEGALRAAGGRPNVPVRYPNCTD